jgi:hypothetical protein
VDQAPVGPPWTKVQAGWQTWRLQNGEGSVGNLTAGTTMWHGSCTVPAVKRVKWRWVELDVTVIGVRKWQTRGTSRRGEMRWGVDEGVRSPVSNEDLMHRLQKWSGEGIRWDRDSSVGEGKRGELLSYLTSKGHGDAMTHSSARPVYRWWRYHVWRKGTTGETEPLLSW